MKFNKTILAAFAVVLPLSAGIGSALSYFTANVAADGTVPVAIVTDTDINEKVVDMKKHVVIKNTGEVPVYIRLIAYAGSEYKLAITSEDNSWSTTALEDVIDGSDSDKYYEYESWVAPGAFTKEIVISIRDENGEMIKPGVDIDAFNVVVAYERTPMAQYDADGNMIYKEDGKTPAPDWNYVAREEEKFPADKSGIVIPKPKTEGGNE